MKIKIRKVIPVTTVRSPVVELGEEYIGKSFTVVESQGEDAVYFADYIRGGINSTSVYEKLTKGYDMQFIENSHAKSDVNILKELIFQELKIVDGELFYPYQNNDEIGIPYLDKKTKSEMDLLILNVIRKYTDLFSNTNVTFQSRLDGRVYSLEFSITMEGVGTEWLSIVI